MILKRRDGSWPGVAGKRYKGEESDGFRGIVRKVLMDSDASAFQARCFEIEPGGYSSHERHEHEHFVLVLQGKGEVLLGEKSHDLGPLDVVIVEPWMPHQFRNTGKETFSFLCVVDRTRDRPVALQNEKANQASNT